MRNHASKVRWVGIFGVLAIGGVILFFVTKRWGMIEQPIAFNHKVHVASLGLECSQCHGGVETGAFATLPRVAVCLECHGAALSENPEEAKVRAYGEAGLEIPWRRLTRQPDHVNFSHQRHVVIAAIGCERCHGAMAERTRPPPTAPMELTMDDCLGCHKQQGATSDCVLCHR